jgi:septum formation protein
MPWPGPVVLASGSPRRLAFLRSLGVEPVVRPADVDETPRPGEDPVAYVRRLAFDKAMAVPVAAGEVIIAADTTVDVDGTILAKPDDAAHARWMLRSLSGRAHLVHTAFTIRLGTDEHRTATDHDTTTVTCVPISDAEIEWYLGTGEPFDKAGAYAIQGHAAVFVERIDGSVSNVVGLPLHRLVALARSLGVELIRSPAR